MVIRRHWPPLGRPFSRREVLGMGAAAVAVASSPNLALAGPASASDRTRAPQIKAQAANARQPTIRPRSDWAGDLGVKGPLVPEDDVRFLLVHHTASTNDYGPDDVVGQIRGFYEFHTGPEKGWSDVAYNFFIDRFGGIWEGREGSVASPIRGDATGGSQGFALLCSLIGNYAEVPVSPEQHASLVQLLAWLGETHAVDTSPGATTSFVSRGSNRWPADTEVVARTISGHRDMSTTSCPGDFAYSLLDVDIPAQVTALRSQRAQVSSTTTAPTEPPSTTEAAAQTAAETPTPSSEPSVGSLGEAADQAAAAPDAVGTSGAGSGDDGGIESKALLGIGAALGSVAAVGGALSRLLPGRRAGNNRSD